MGNRYQQERADKWIGIGLQLLQNQAAQKSEQDRYKEQQRLAEEARAEEKRRYEDRKGIEASEREKEQSRYEAQQKLAKEARDEEKRRYGIKEGREARKFAIDEEEYRNKKQFEAHKKGFDAARAKFEAGNIRGGLRDIKTIVADWPDGDEVGIVLREDVLSKQESSEIRNIFEQNKDANIAVFSKQDGIITFKSADDLLKYVAPQISYDKYIEDVKKSDDMVAEANRVSQPFVDENGDVVKKTWIKGKGGRLEEGPVVPYTGAMPESKSQRKIREMEGSLGRKSTDEEKQVALGIRERSKDKEPKEPDLGKTLDTDKKALKIALEPFAGQEKPVIDTFGKVTREGKTAINVAYAIVSKAERKEKLTDEENRWLPKAKSAVNLYESIFGKIKKEYLGGDEGDLMSWKAYQKAPLKMGIAH